MAKKLHFALIRQGAMVWNPWRKAFPSGIVDLSGADLSRVNLRGANLIGANLIGADLYGTNLIEAHLIGANLHGANLHQADLRRAMLRGANLNAANLHGANLHGATLTQTEFRIARAGDTQFTNVDLSEALHLDMIRHEGPSSVGTDTLLRSHGAIPEAFLRGCGVPESLIEYLPSLLGAMEPIQFYSCFISYSTQNEEFARRLHGRMQQEKLRVWFAPEDIKGGKKVHEQIDQAIRVYDKLLLVLSQESIQSEWVMTEIRKARRAEVGGQKRKLFPIRLIDYEALLAWECRDSVTGTDVAEEVRQYFIPDFTQWKNHDKFEAAFDRLLRDLKAAT